MLNLKISFKNFFLLFKNNYSRHSELYKNISVIVIFLILPYIFFAEGFKITQVLHGHGDVLSFTLPLKNFLAENLRNFNFPLWNPLSANGFPFLADIQSGVLYPINIIFSFISPLILSYNLSLFLHYSLAGIFTYFFVREYDLTKLSSFISGLAFMFSGALVIRKIHPQMIFVIVWLPLILMLLEKFIKRNNIKYLLAASLFFSFHFFAGNPQIFIYAVSIEVTYFIFIYFRDRKLKTINFKEFVFGFLIFLFSGICLILIQLLPTYELMKLGFRVKLTFEDFSSFSFNLKDFLILFFPYVFGKMNPAQYKDVLNIFSGNYIETGGYLGIFSFFLALLGINIKNKNKWFWISLVIISFILVLGETTPIYKLLYYVPIYNKFRIPTRNFVELSFSLAIFSGFGVDYLLKANYENFKKKYFTFISLILIIPFSFFIYYYFFRKSIRLESKYFLSYEVSNIINSFSLNKSSVFIPLILIILSLIFFTTVLILKKRNFFNNRLFLRLFLIIIPIFVFFDLFYFGHNFEPFLNRDLKPLISSNYYDTYKYLKKENDIFRTYSLFYNLEPYDSNIDVKDMAGNNNLFYNLSTISIYDPLYMKNVQLITKLDWIGDGADKSYDLLTNNNVLSVLNAKYIIISKELIKNYGIANYLNKINLGTPQNSLGFEDIVKLSKTNESFIINNPEKSFKFKDVNQILKIINIPFEIDNESFYEISFKVKKEINSELLSEGADPYLHLDFYGLKDNKEVYDNGNQEIIIHLGEINLNYREYKLYINSEIVPEDINSFFRIFTWSGSGIFVKDLEIKKIYDNGTANYKIVNEVKDSLLIENKNYLPRIYFAENILNVKDIYEVENNIWKDDFNPKKFTIIENYDLNKVKFDNFKNRLDIINYKNNYVDIAVNCNEDSFLIFSDTYYLGWHAYIDGVETKIYKVNGIFKGLYVPAGEHKIRFRFLPNDFLIGAIVSGITFFIIIILLCIPRVKSKKFFSKREKIFN